MRDQVEGDPLGELLVLHLVGDEYGARLREQFVHAFLAGAGDRLVGRDDETLDRGMIVQRLQRNNELGRGAVRIGDDVLLREALDSVGIDLGYDQRNVAVVAPGRRIVDHDTALGGDLRRPFLRYRAAGRHQADVAVGEVVILERLDLERLVAIGNFLADRAARGERHDGIGRKPAVGEDFEHLAPDIAGRACDCDCKAHGPSFCSLSPLLWQAPLVPPPGECGAERSDGFRGFRRNDAHGGGYLRQRCAKVNIAVKRPLPCWQIIERHLCRRNFMRIVYKLAAAAAIAAGAAGTAQADFIRCPLDQARRTVTDPLPSGWWTTPIVNRLSETRIQNIGGKPALICVYGSSGSVQREAPAGQTCRAARGGFECARAAGGGAVTHATGGLDIPQTYLFDLDRGAVTQRGADFWFQAETASLLYLVPRNGARIGVGNRTNRGAAGCAAARMSTSRVSLSDLPVGSYVCARTNEGRISQFRVNGISPGSPKTLSIGFTTWR